MDLKFKRIEAGHNNPLPAFESTGAAGIDLRARQGNIMTPGAFQKFDTGYAVAIPEGYVGLICPRSGLALKEGVTVLNAPGVIDSDYRGELGVILVNHNSRNFVVQAGMRIAQLVIVPAASLMTMNIELVDDLDDTERGAGGFGSTGRL